MIEYTKSQAAEITGLSPRNVQHYTDQGVIVPSESLGGKGHHRRYSMINLCELLLLKEFMEYGIALSTADMMVKGLKLGLKERGIGIESLIKEEEDPYIFQIIKTLGRMKGELSEVTNYSSSFTAAKGFVSPHFICRYSELIDYMSRHLAISRAGEHEGEDYNFEDIFDKSFLCINLNKTLFRLKGE